MESGGEGVQTPNPLWVQWLGGERVAPDLSLQAPSGDEERNREDESPSDGTDVVLID